MLKSLILLDTSSKALEFCSKFTPIWTILGYVIFAVKIIVPILLIVTGMITLVKGIMNQKDEMNKVFNLLIKKVIIALAVFLVIQITGSVVNLVAKSKDYEQCAKCTFKPFDSGCYLVLPASEYVPPKKNNNTTPDNSNANNDIFKNLELTNAAYFNHQAFLLKKFTIPSINKNELCYQNSSCKEELEEDGMIRVYQGVFYYTKNKQYNGTDVAKGSATLDGKSGLNKTFAARLKVFFDAAKKSGYTIWVKNQGFRTIDEQNYFYCCYNGTGAGTYCPGKGCNEGNTAAVPGTSKHGYGIAADLGFCNGTNNKSCNKDKEAVMWAHDNAETYGLAFNVRDEDWHITVLYYCDLTGSDGCGRTTNYLCSGSTKSRGTQTPFQSCG